MVLTIWYNWSKQLIGYMRIFLLLGFLICSGLVMGQELKLLFKTGGMSILDFKEIKEHGFEIGTYGKYWYEFVGEKLIKHDLRRFENPRIIPHKSNVYDANDIPRSVTTRMLIAKKVKHFIDSVQISSVQDTVQEFNIAPWHKGNVLLSFIESNAGILKIEHSIFEAEFIRSEFDSLVISDVEFINEVKIENTILPDYIQLDRVTCKDGKFQIDFTRFLIGDLSGVCDLNIGKGAADLIRANYKYFNLVFDSSTSVYDKEWIYTELMNMQRANYFLDGYEKLDKEYKAFKYYSRNSFVAKLQNWIDKHWWDYEYNKFMVIQNSIYLFLLFFAINLLAYKGLAKVYHPEKFKKFDERLDSNNTEDEFSMATRVKNYIIRIPAIFLYTAFVFWGLKLDLKELELKKPLYMTILIGQYITGLVCLAYIANYIISK